jgi:hypothetical protein
MAVEKFVSRGEVERVEETRGKAKRFNLRILIQEMGAAAFVIFVLYTAKTALEKRSRNFEEQNFKTVSCCMR